MRNWLRSLGYLGIASLAAGAEAKAAGGPAFEPSDRMRLDARVARAAAFLQQQQRPQQAPAPRQDMYAQTFPNFPNFARQFPNFPNFANSFNGPGRFPPNAPAAPNFPNFPNFQNFYSR